jgi:transketolase
VVFYDYNHITIEGATALAYSDDVRQRFEGYGWQVLDVDGHDLEQLDAALTQARASADRPTLIIGRTIIGRGAPKAQGTSEVHGAPLGAEELRAAKQALGLPPEEMFWVPESVRELFAARAAEGAAARQAWARVWKRYRQDQPELAAQWTTAQKGMLPADLEAALPAFDPAKPVATRSASGQVLQGLAKAVPSLVGGSADLAPSNNTYLKGLGDIGPGRLRGPELPFRHPRAWHGGGDERRVAARGFRIFGGTFLVFADYCRPSIRLAALMGAPVIYVFTHDSFGVGEDGPTHQPVEHLASLRAIPGLTVIRPADATETGAAWVAALRNTRGPTALLLTRQNLPILDRTALPPASELNRGGYILWENRPGEKPARILIASGSEVSTALEAARTLAQAPDAPAIRVVSMPSWELFEAQKPKYRRTVLPPACKARLVVEAGIRMGWEKYAGPRGRYVTMDHFGASGPHGALLEKFGFTAAQVADAARALR